MQNICLCRPMARSEKKSEKVITWHCSVCLRLTDFLCEPAQSSHSLAEWHQSGPELEYWYRLFCPEQRDTHTATHTDQHIYTTYSKSSELTFARGR